MSSTGWAIGSYIEAGTVGPVQTEGRNRCKLYHSVNQATVNITQLILAWDSEQYDNGGLHSGGSNTRITIPSGGNIGSWRISAQVCWAANAAGERRIGIIKNGSMTGIAWSTQLPISGRTFQSASTDEDAPVVGDYYEVVVDQSSGGGLNVEGAPASTFFTALHQW